MKLLEQIILKNTLDLKNIQIFDNVSYFQTKNSKGEEVLVTAPVIQNPIYVYNNKLIDNIQHCFKIIDEKHIQEFVDLGYLTMNKTLLENYFKVPPLSIYNLSNNQYTHYSITNLDNLELDLEAIVLSEIKNHKTLALTLTAGADSRFIYYVAQKYNLNLETVTYFSEGRREDDVSLKLTEEFSTNFNLYKYKYQDWLEFKNENLQDYLKKYFNYWSIPHLQDKLFILKRDNSNEQYILGHTPFMSMTGYPESYFFRGLKNSINFKHFKQTKVDSNDPILGTSFNENYKMYLWETINRHQGFIYYYSDKIDREVINPLWNNQTFGYILSRLKNERNFNPKEFFITSLLKLEQELKVKNQYTKTNKKKLTTLRNSKFGRTLLETPYRVFKNFKKVKKVNLKDHYGMMGLSSNETILENWNPKYGYHNYFALELIKILKKEK
jgi:hypothetical protein